MPEMFDPTPWLSLITDAWLRCCLDAAGMAVAGLSGAEHEEEFYHEPDPYADWRQRWLLGLQVRKPGYAMQVNTEVLQQAGPTLDQRMAAAEQRERRRRYQRKDEILVGPHLNPCIILGEN